jgi:hypothetical protein
MLRPERNARDALQEMREHGAAPEGEGSEEGVSVYRRLDVD